MIKNLSLATTALIICALLGEGGLQIAYRMQQGKWLWKGDAFHVSYTQPVSDRRQYSLRPNWTNQEDGITINRLGFRGPLLDPETPVVVALGDSVPFGAGVKDRETYPAKLDALLRGTQTAVRVLNAGVPSYNLRQSFDRLRLEVLSHYKAPILVTVQAANDISLLTQYRERYTPDVTWASVRWQGSWGRPWFAKSATANYLERVLDHSLPPELERHNPYPADAMLQNVSQVLDEGLRVCRERNLPVVLLPVDLFYYQTKNVSLNERLSRWSRRDYQVYAQMWGPSINKLNDIISGKAKASDRIFFLDTRQLLDDQDREHMFIDFLHYSPEGNALIAKALLDMITRDDLLDQVRASAK